MALFDEAKEEHRAGACRQMCERANRSLDAQDTADVLRLLETSGETCGCLKAAAMDAAELSYTEGVKSFDENAFSEALLKLRTALKLRPDHDLAGRYLEFTEAKLRLNADAALLEWRRNIDARQFAAATGTYRQLERSNVEGIASAQLSQIQEGYRQLLSQSITDWKRACQDGDSTAMRLIWARAIELIPDRDLAESVLGDMKCASKFCQWADTSTVMPRLTSRIEPIVSPALRRSISGSTTVYAHVRIDETGNVAVLETQGVHPGIRDAVRSAVEQWKFSPNSGRQECVETILPVLIQR
jgi:hypothetical protein